MPTVSRANVWRQSHGPNSTVWTGSARTSERMLFSSAATNQLLAAQTVGGRTTNQTRFRARGRRKHGLGRERKMNHMSFHLGAATCQLLAVQTVGGRATNQTNTVWNGSALHFLLCGHKPTVSCANSWRQNHNPNTRFGKGAHTEINYFPKCGHKPTVSRANSWRQSHVPNPFPTQGRETRLRRERTI